MRIALILHCFILSALIDNKSSLAAEDFTDYFLPSPMTRIKIQHELSGIKEIISYFTFKQNYYMNIKSKISEIRYVYQIKDKKIIKIAELSGWVESQMYMHSILSNRNLHLGDLIEDGKFKVISISETLKTPEGILKPCILAKALDQDTQLTYCKGYGLVKKWNPKAPANVSKGFSIIQSKLPKTL